MDLRLPRVLTAMVVGTGLAVAGATFQGLLRNPLADPYVLGTASGAALGAAIAVVLPVRGLVLEFGLLHLLAFVGALGSVTLVYRLSRTGPLAPLTSLLLTGYAVGSLLAAGLSLAMYMSGTGLRQIFSYLLGGFDGASWTRLAVAAPLIIGGSARDPRSAPAPSTGSCSARRRRPTSASTCGGSGRSCSSLASLVTAAGGRRGGPDRLRRARRAAPRAARSSARTRGSCCRSPPCSGRACSRPPTSSRGCSAACRWASSPR